ncbi:Uu.00g139270.m01.CDS01 [Anthostomella pinea]|uniref:Uu.00g139270.m01.CDS01 n=1 Tax=Anthostomella pinea TaxID=933095 RepID=A0AAI8VPZ2_9PEZI|nr:Uu.00g139270.m01.CDS01 [Anthostomella pinea]
MAATDQWQMLHFFLRVSPDDLGEISEVVKLVKQKRTKEIAASKNAAPSPGQAPQKNRLAGTRAGIIQCLSEE